MTLGASRGRAAAFAGALLASPALACGSPPEPAARPDKDVQVLREEHTPDKLVARGRAFQQVGDLVRAEQYFAAALQAGGDAKEILPLLLKVCIDATRFQAAIEYAEPHLQRHPEDYRLRMLVASLYAAVGQPARARTHYERVLESQPDEATAHWALALLLRDQLGDRQAADVHFREYLRLRPDGPHAEEARASLLKPVVVGPTPLPTPLAGPAGANGGAVDGSKPTPPAPPPGPVKIEGKKP